MGDLRNILNRIDPPAVQPDDFACGACEDTGWRETEVGAVRRCECRDAPTPVSELLARLVPKRYRGCTFEAWEGGVPPVVSAWIEEPRDALYLCGRQGRGKTHLGTAVFGELLARGLRGEWRDASALVNFCRRNLDDAGRELDRVEAADVVMLDDFHLARTDYAREVLDGVVRALHLRCAALIVTSNAPLRDLVSDRDPAILSRLRGHEIELDGPDWRGPRIDNG